MSSNGQVSVSRDRPGGEQRSAAETNDHVAPQQQQHLRALAWLGREEPEDGREEGRGGRRGSAGGAARKECKGGPVPPAHERAGSSCTSGVTLDARTCHCEATNRDLAGPSGQS